MIPFKTQKGKMTKDRGDHDVFPWGAGHGIDEGLPAWLYGVTQPRGKFLEALGPRFGSPRLIFEAHVRAWVLEV